MMKFIGIALLAALVAGCSDADGARDTLRKQGFTNIETQGHAWFACSEDDWVATKFTATSVAGYEVEGAVCSGLLFKNSTIRMD